jgi:2-polyprenyl-3-methyl-5-hydroxy-6-metoxy-1,4-benzoquinol methylase
MRFADYIPVDVERLRPSQSYREMIEIREGRMQRFLGPDGLVRSELVEDVACPVCGSDRHEELFRKEGFTFVTCGACSLVYVNPQLRTEAVREVYEDESYSTIVRRLVASSNDYRKERFGAERMGIVDRFATVSPGRLLDVGCTTGFFLEAAAERGWSAVGIDPNPYAIDVAREKGLTVEQATIEDASFEAESFDAITVFDVIEHLRRPLDLLAKARELLRPGGVVLLYTPNWECAERLLIGEACHFIWGTNHLTYFTADTLGQALERSGLEAVWHETRGLDVEDVIWYLDETGQVDTEFARRFRHELQFLADASGYGKNLRMIGRRA